MKDELVRKFVLYSGECEYQIHLRFKYKDKPWIAPTIYHPPSLKNLNKIKNLEENEKNSVKMVN